MHRSCWNSVSIYNSGVKNSCISKWMHHSVLQGISIYFVRIPHSVSKGTKSKENRKVWLFSLGREKRELDLCGCYVREKLKLAKKEAKNGCEF